MADFQVQNAVNLIKRLRSRFDLQELNHRSFILPSVILPITDADKAILVYRAKKLNDAIRTASEGTGQFVLFTVPRNRRYYIRALQVVRSSGDGTIAHLYCRDPINNVSVKILATSAAASIQYDVGNEPIILDPGMSLWTNCSSITTDSTWQVLAYLEEEILE